MLRLLEVNFKRYTLDAHAFHIRIIDAQAIEQFFSRFVTVSLRARRDTARRRPDNRIAVWLVDNHARCGRYRVVPHYIYPVAPIALINYMTINFNPGQGRDSKAVAAAGAEQR